MAHLDPTRGMASTTHRVALSLLVWSGSRPKRPRRPYVPRCPSCPLRRVTPGITCWFCRTSSFSASVAAPSETPGGKSGEPLELPLGISVFDHNVAALDVTEVTQSLEEGLPQVGASGPEGGRQEAQSRDLGRQLRLGGERRGEQHSTRTCEERPPLHYSIT